MTRTVTRNQDKLFIPPGGIDFSSQTNKPGVVDIYLRAGDNTPGTGLHWHETHTEYLQVVQGYALVTVGDRTAIFSKDDGIITIPRYTIHQYMRADKTDEGKAGKDVDLIVREWTEPGDGDRGLLSQHDQLDHGQEGWRIGYGRNATFCHDSLLVS
ncbi:Alpha-glucosidase [Fusarium oxysporum f. sp. albedinis]|nr:Alpha-glucosidase [Fusarium oxysporum f. sp. albedinis]KAK2478955.1 hypothetical protein H9L39_08329 [Fusarium oxysporum f. sp. albedinis]